MTLRGIGGLQIWWVFDFLEFFDFYPFLYLLIWGLRWKVLVDMRCFDMKW